VVSHVERDVSTHDLRQRIDRALDAAALHRDIVLQGAGGPVLAGLGKHEYLQLGTHRGVYRRDAPDTTGHYESNALAERQALDLRERQVASRREGVGSGV